MRITSLVRALGLAAVVTAGGCKSLDIVNPNAPDAERALSDPSTVEAVAGGAVRVWFNTYEGLTSVGPLVTQAQTYSASWNNFNINFYSGVDNPSAGPAAWNRNTRSWQNDPSAAARTSVEFFWEGYYKALTLANLTLRAIRVNNLEINTPADTRRAEAMALLMQGAALSGIAMNYDKGYVITETTDLSTVAYSDRKALRDAARASFDEAIAVANANTFTTPSSWANGIGYTNVQISKMANTMAAYLLANWGRDSTENAAADWPGILAYTANGLSAAPAVDYVLIGDGNNWYPEILAWFNAMDTGRVSTRVATMLDPGTQVHPYPTGGNGQPNSPDNRLGDGSFGTAGMVAGFGNAPLTGGAGTDFAWSSQEIFNAARGSYHQSNIAHIRYDLTGVQAPTGAYGGLGPAPVFTATQNDLLRAEALIRTGGSLATAATLINNSRVARGGLTAAVAGDGIVGLSNMLDYESEVELLGLGAASYYFRRRRSGLLPGTPHEMPVPAKELGVFEQALYTWGGASPANSPTPP